jgi:hypothetical protein
VDVALDARFRHEREHFRLYLYCEDCALFDEGSERCVHGYPTAAHRRPRDPASESKVTFCKEFELA